MTDLNKRNETWDQRTEMAAEASPGPDLRRSSMRVKEEIVF